MTETLWRHKYLIEYELSPSEIYVGPNWVTLKLKNIGGETLQHLDIQLHSLDTYARAQKSFYFLTFYRYIHEIKHQDNQYSSKQDEAQ
jgi:hypothetical protein